MEQNPFLFPYTINWPRFLICFIFSRLRFLSASFGTAVDFYYFSFFVKYSSQTVCEMRFFQEETDVFPSKLSCGFQHDNLHDSQQTYRQYSLSVTMGGYFSHWFGSLCAVVVKHSVLSPSGVMKLGLLTCMEGVSVLCNSQG